MKSPAAGKQQETPALRATAKSGYPLEWSPPLPLPSPSREIYNLLAQGSEIPTEAAREGDTSGLVAGKTKWMLDTSP